MTGLLYLALSAIVFFVVQAIAYAPAGIPLLAAAYGNPGKIIWASRLGSLAWPAGFLITILIVSKLGWIEKMGLAPGSAVLLLGMGVLLGFRKAMFIPLLSVALFGASPVAFIVLLVLSSLRKAFALLAAGAMLGAMPEKSQAQAEVERMYKRVGAKKEAAPKLIVLPSAMPGFLPWPGRDRIFLGRDLMQPKNPELALTDQEMDAIVAHELSHAKQNELALWASKLVPWLAQTIGMWIVFTGKVEPPAAATIAILSLVAASRLYSYLNERKADSLSIKTGLAEPLYRGLYKLIQIGDNSKGLKTMLFWVTPAYLDEHGSPVARQLRLGKAAGLDKQEVLEDIAQTIKNTVGERMEKKGAEVKEESGEESGREEKPEADREEPTDMIELPD